MNTDFRKRLNGMLREAKNIERICREDESEIMANVWFGRMDALREVIDLLERCKA